MGLSPLTARSREESTGLWETAMNAILARNHTADKPTALDRTNMFP
jgi:hypothetical protein